MKLVLGGLGLLAGFIAVNASAAISVRDDYGNGVTLQHPAQRIISMAPHVTELLFAAGGGDRIVGAVSYSDYPEAARRIPRIGDNRQVDIERIVALKPDLLVVWRHGSSERQVEQLRQLGIPLFYSEPHKLDDIPDSVLRLGRLLGTDPQANQAATDLRQQLSALAERYANRSKVRMFYQVWDKPLYTLNGQHIVSDAIRLCGGENVLAGKDTTAPTVKNQAVLQQKTEDNVSTRERRPAEGGANLWKPYSILTATRRGNLMTIDGNLLNRAGPRMIAGATQLCERLEQVRQHRRTTQ
jgi:iron complex transport system substrate-binding protein